MVLDDKIYIDATDSHTMIFGATGSIEAFISMGLNKLCINEEFIDFLSQKGLDLQALADKKNTIYLVIPDENKSYHFVASLFLEQLYEVLIEKAQSEAELKLPIRMNFLIDEFANIPKIGNMDVMITAARSRNIRFHLIVQGMKQLEQKYPDGVADTIIGNCNNWVCERAQIDSKAAIGLMISRKLAEMELEVEYVEWYSADKSKQISYNNRKEYYPEEVEGNRKVLGSVDAYVGHIGTRYLLNHAFRKANQELKGNGYAEAKWKYEGKKTAYDGMAIYRFAKKNLNQ